MAAGRHARQRGSGEAVRIWGRHPVEAALRNEDRPCHRLQATAPALAALGPLASRKALIVETMTLPQLDRAVPPDSPHQGLVLDAGPLPPRSLDELVPTPDAPGLLLALDQVSDPRNLGAILRSAAALGVTGVVVPRHGSAELGGICAKAASGALDLVPIVEVVNLARSLGELKELGFWLVGLDATSPVRLEALPPAPRRVLVLGAEGAGLRRLVAETCDQLASLRMAPRMESLNVAVAAGIALYLLAPERP
jgi:23S rRNA (guanosine2251-2'-O)-methyltransferase